MAVKERLLMFIKSTGYNISGFETLCGLSNSYVNNIGKSIGVDKLEQISSKFPGINKIWLLHGEGEMVKSVEEPKVNEVIKKERVSEQTLHNLSESHRLLSEAHLKQIEANTELIKLVKISTANASQFPSEVYLTKFSDMLEVLADIGSGKRWKDKPSALLELSKSFHAS